MKKGYFNDNMYGVLKFITQVLLPALGTLYVALAGLWGLPSAEAIGGTVLAVDTFLGVVLHLSTANYNASDAKYAGTVHVGQENEDGLHNVRISGLPVEAKEIANKKELRLKVQPEVSEQRGTE